MKKLVLSTLAVLITLSVWAQSYEEALKIKSGQLKVHYLNQYPLAYENESGELTGIEIDLVMAFAEWMQRTKGIKLSFEFEQYESFAGVYEHVIKANLNELGLASAAITKERQKQVAFSPPYMRNASLLVSNIDVPTVRAYADMPKSFANMTALVMRGTTLEQHLMVVKKQHFEKMRVSYVEHPREIVRQIAQTNNQYYGYVDILTYWAVLKESPANVKIHRAVTIDNQRFGVLLPRGSDWKRAWDEFMEGGFGFAATERYYNILRKHLGYEVIESVTM
ncbi:MAG: hypothetical protein C0424_09850 [Sphingobacteriaceae bacterium]|nr:hypothetical protein [Sphingobacteriaceae bacterium]